jgi:hypothetical protein
LDERHWQADLPIVDVSDELMALAQIVYEGKGMITSAVRCIVPSRDMAGARPSDEPSDVISAWNNGTDGWYIFRGTDFLHAHHPEARLCSGELGGRSALLFESEGPVDTVHVATRLFVDPARNKGGSRRLEFWTHDLAAITVRKDWFLRKLNVREYETRVGGGPGWQRHVVGLEDFTETGGSELVRPPSDWNTTYQLSFEGKPVENGHVGFGLVRWTDSEAACTESINTKEDDG